MSQQYRTGGSVFPNWNPRIRIWIRKKNPELYYFIEDLNKFVEKVQYFKSYHDLTLLIGLPFPDPGLQICGSGSVRNI